MNSTSSVPARAGFFRVIATTVVFVAMVAAAWALWPPVIRPWLLGNADVREGKATEDAAHQHAGDHTHSKPHPGHDDAAAIELTEMGLKNIAFEPFRVYLTTFERKITIPGQVVERPGRSQIGISAPLAGVITRIYPVEGQAIEPHSPMFEIRLTHEELVDAQRRFLLTLENLDVVQSEIARLKNAGEGVIAGRRILEQEYEQKKLSAQLRAERQALLLHGLTAEQVAGIERDRRLLPSLTVRAPDHSDDTQSCQNEHLLHLQSLSVRVGEHVEAGHLLAVVADHCELFIEGHAFEDDAEYLRRAAQEDCHVTALVAVGDRQVHLIEDLRIMYLSDHVDPETRTLRFYVALPNEVALDRTTSDGHRFITWRYSPGQRMELRIPIERWERKMVIPAEAVIEEGAEAFVYEKNGDHFDRVPVHVEYRDPTSVVISSDGGIQEGDVIAGRGAYQLHLALKNKTAPSAAGNSHAGHSH